MLGRRFFFQVIAVSFLGLTLFALLASFAWNVIGEDQFNRGLFQRTTALAELLLPSGDISSEEQRVAVLRVSEALSVDMTLYDGSGLLIAASGKSAPWVDPVGVAGQWQATEGQTRWTTMMNDGRVLIIDLSRVQIPNETLAVTVTFAVLALVISFLLYPLTRRITHRLERLQDDVERVGAGDLSARVTVDGEDEIAKLAMSFNRSTDTIEDLVNHQRLLLANASHELRTPLARIRMAIELMETKNTAKRRAEVRQDIQELDALIDDLITMMRFDAGTPKDRFTLVNLSKIVGEECGRTLDCSFKGEELYVLGDTRMLQHLTRNLIDNAVKHGAMPVWVRLTVEDKGINLAVIDNGPGICAKDHKRVFEPFYRGSGKQNVSGYGLGLPLVARIAKAHDAEVFISQEPQSKVTVRFPSLPTKTD